MNYHEETRIYEDIFEYCYYSFIVGAKGLKKKDWVRIDLKLPARDVRAALYIYYFLERSKFMNQYDFIQPSVGWIDHFIRQVIEYTRTPTPQLYYTQHHYKKSKISTLTNL